MGQYTLAINGGPRRYDGTDANGQVPGGECDRCRRGRERDGHVQRGGRGRQRFDVRAAGHGDEGGGSRGGNSGRDDDRWILNPSANLVAGRLYSVTLTGGASAIRDGAGNALAAASWSFRTAY